MRIRTIISRRVYCTWRSWQLVYEWEDVFKKEMKISSYSINFDVGLSNRLGRCFKYLYNKLPIRWFWKHRPAFVFEMLPSGRLTNHNNSPYVVPCIIDWYLRSQDEINDFFKLFSNHKVIVITSKQVFQYLSSIPTPVPFAHLPLSLSDKWRITPNTVFKKDIDVVLMGRQNPVLLNWLKEYMKTHPNITVASSKREKDNYTYRTQDGEFVARAISREDCMGLLKRSKVNLYSTKGMDEDYTDFKTNGFSQVTPRLFESIATGNHVIARYNRNEDTEYFELDKICPHTDCYQSFEAQMDYALNHPVDMKMYSQYLEKHYTSTRVKLLEDIIKTL